MTKQQLEGGKRALVIVAHPDDETIWMGGFILKQVSLHWTILSLCRADDPDRAPKFARVCKFLKADSLMDTLDDEGNLTYEQSLTATRKLILTHLKNQEFDYIFTHGKNGEYGHEAHCAVHEVIQQLVKENKIKAKKIFFFNYKKINKKEYSPLTAKNDSDLIFTLSKKEFAQKKKIMSDIYGFDPNGIDTNYCTNPEAFKILNLK